MLSERESEIQTEERRFQDRVKPLGMMLIKVTIAISCLFSALAAQTDDAQADDPPPLKTLSKSEKSALAAEQDPKKRTRLSLDLMEARLKKSEELKEQSQFRSLFFELGVFQGLMEDALSFLVETNVGKSKTFDSLKRFEMGLREMTPRLELIRREVPDRYEGYMKQLLKAVREARAKAVEPMFGDSVVPGS